MKKEIKEKKIQKVKNLLIIATLLIVCLTTKVNAASYDLQNNGTTMYFNPSGSASIKWDTLYYDSASDRAPYRFNAKVESVSSNTDNGNPFVFDGTYLIDFYIYGIGSFYSNYNCTDFTSNFSYVSPTTGSTVSNANNISSTCVDVYKTTYANNNAIHILYKFKLATESYDTGATEFTFNIYKYNFFTMLSTGFNYGLHVGSINSYSEDIVSSFLEQKNNQTIINQNQTIIDSDINAEDKVLPNDEAFEDYSETENTLKDKVNQADMSVISIGIDANSSSWVWDTLTRLIQSHSIIFGMFISILSIGIIKLALGR